MSPLPFADFNSWAGLHSLIVSVLQAITTKYILPPKHKHTCALKPGVKMPEPVLQPHDYAIKIPRMTRGLCIVDLIDCVPGLPRPQARPGAASALGAYGADLAGVLTGRAQQYGGQMNLVNSSGAAVPASMLHRLPAADAHDELAWSGTTSHYYGHMARGMPPAPGYPPRDAPYPPYQPSGYGGYQVAPSVQPRYPASAPPPSHYAPSPYAPSAPPSQGYPGYAPRADPYQRPVYDSGRGSGGAYDSRYDPRYDPRGQPPPSGGYRDPRDSRDYDAVRRDYVRRDDYNRGGGGSSGRDYRDGRGGGGSGGGGGRGGYYDDRRDTSRADSARGSYFRR